MSEQREDKVEQRHEPVPGYKTAFYAVFAIVTVYLVIIFAVG
ncbi:hypothetical protein MNBD_NITROSPINAE04-1717 [hydrothermal vent metagenome]|uniref:Uncharacterized protein n=1 Tax=hydrothermal vent metagenome TaxID=652676 RepID=A0A3B1CNS3_9ZZZZ